MRVLPLVLIMTACGPDVQRPSGLLPSIDAFFSIPEVSEPMGEVTLFWDTTNVSAVDIGPDIARNAEPDGSITVNNQWGMQYTMTAKGDGALTLATLTVAAVPPTMPFIHLFVAEPTRVIAGSPTTLRWLISDASFLWIGDMRGNLVYMGDQLDGFAEIVPVADNPGGTAIYQLAAMDVWGQYAEMYLEVGID